MRFFSRFSIVVTLLALAVPNVSAQTPAEATKGVRVFNAGHSFHMPIVQPLGQIAKLAGIEDHKFAGSQSIGGSTVTQHWQRADATNTAKKAILAKGVDVLTLSPHYMLPDPAIDKFVDLLLENNPNGRVTLQASWIPYDGHYPERKGWTGAMRDEADIAKVRELGEPYYARLREQAKTINEAHAAKTRRQVVFIVPAGEALNRLRERVKKGEVPGIAKQSDLFRDDLGHGGPPMGVLTAYCTYAVIYGKSPVGLPVPEALKAAKLGDNTEKVNRILQECAWEAVTSEPMSGVKGTK